jgi:RNA polymerase sigma-70 factor (ECF subfamily)
MVKTGAADIEPVLSWPQSVAGFDALIETTQHRLIQFAYCRVQSLADAEDVVQDVFVRAYRDRARYQDVDNVIPFLYRMVANRSTDLLRKRKHTADGPLGDAPAAPVADDPHAGIERLLDRLPARQAAVIRLRIYGDLPFDAVARSIGCSVPTVKSRFRYGIQKLRRLLERKGGVL